MIYYKVTNEDENHNGFQYKDGLNILDEPLQKQGSCVKGGLYFTTKEHLHKFYNYGVWVREVTFPINDPEFEMIEDPLKDKWRANKIILGKRYSLFDFNTFKLLELDINLDIIYNAVERNEFKFLKLCLENKPSKFEIPESFILRVLRDDKISGHDLVNTNKTELELDPNTFIDIVHFVNKGKEKYFGTIRRL